MVLDIISDRALDGFLVTGNASTNNQDVVSEPRSLATAAVTNPLNYIIISYAIY